MNVDMTGAKHSPPPSLPPSLPTYHIIQSLLSLPLDRLPLTEDHRVRRHDTIGGGFRLHHLELDGVHGLGREGGREGGREERLGRGWFTSKRKEKEK